MALAETSPKRGPQPGSAVRTERRGSNERPFVPVAANPYEERRSPAPSASEAARAANVAELLARMRLMREQLLPRVLREGLATTEGALSDNARLQSPWHEPRGVPEKASVLLARMRDLREDLQKLAGQPRASVGFGVGSAWPMGRPVAQVEGGTKRREGWQSLENEGGGSEGHSGSEGICGEREAAPRYGWRW